MIKKLSFFRISLSLEHQNNKPTKWQGWNVLCEVHARSKATQNVIATKEAAIKSF